MLEEFQSSINHILDDTRFQLEGSRLLFRIVSILLPGKVWAACVATGSLTEAFGLDPGLTLAELYEENRSEFPSEDFLQ